MGENLPRQAMHISYSARTISTTNSTSQKGIRSFATVIAGVPDVVRGSYPLIRGSFGAICRLADVIRGTPDGKWGGSDVVSGS